jgi:hypothetical protein
MSDDCANLANCGFFKKYNGEKRAACMGFIRLYCQGEQQGCCERKKYRAEHNAPPPDNMMPNGAMCF